jgi:ferredoxin-NADP reductase
MAAINWLVATVAGIHPETPRVKTLSLDVPGWMTHRAGQHVDVRLTAEDGYQAERSYSIASAPTDHPTIDLTVERVPDGEVSPFLNDELRIGDRFEVRGPIGGYFVWDPTATDPLFLIAGGSGIVPLMAIVRERERAGSRVPCTLLYSSRTPDDEIYSEELNELGGAGDGLRVVSTFTREQPPGWTGYARRIDMAMISEVLETIGRKAQVFVCGPTPLVESAAGALIGLGLSPGQIKTERFGPSGG